MCHTQHHAIHGLHPVGGAARSFLRRQGPAGALRLHSYPVVLPRSCNCWFALVFLWYDFTQDYAEAVSAMLHTAEKRTRETVAYVRDLADKCEQAVISSSHKLRADAAGDARRTEDARQLGTLCKERCVPGCAQRCCVPSVATRWLWRGGAGVPRQTPL